MDSLGYLEKNPGTVDEVKVRYAGFWIRFAAFLVDVIICSAIYLIPYFILMALELYFNWSSDDPSEALVIFSIILAVIVFWLYESLFLSSRYMATPGKMLFKLKVTDMTGNRVSFQNASSRSFVKFCISIICAYFLDALPVLIIFMISPAFILFNPKKMALYDTIANTIVVYKNANSGASNSIVT
jgi:uncharacterized RDD family membrane protein YckC